MKFHVMISLDLIDRTVQFLPCVLGFTALYHWEQRTPLCLSRVVNIIQKRLRASYLTALLDVVSSLNIP